MTTSYHPEFDNPRSDVQRRSLNDCIHDDEDNASQNHLLPEQDAASVSTVTRNASINASMNASISSSVLATTPHNEPNRTKSLSASSSPDPYTQNHHGALCVKTNFRKSTSSGHLSSSMPSTATTSPARFSSSNVSARRKAYDMGKVEKIIRLTSRQILVLILANQWQNMYSTRSKIQIHQKYQD